MGRSLFITLFLGLFVLADVYIYAAIRQLTKSWSTSAQRTTGIIYWAVPIVCILIFVLTFFVLNDRLPFKLRNFLASFIFIIYLSKLLTAALLIVGDIIKYVKAGYDYLLSKIDSTPETTVDNSSKITRSEFITKTALTLGAAHIGAMSYGIISGAHDYRIRRVPLKLNNLPQKFNGLKLAQISDIHSGSFFNKTAVSGGIDMLLGEKPDIVFFTGDLVNNKAEELSDYFDVFKRVQAPLGVYSTLGNHDYGDYTSWSSPQEKQLNLETLKEGHKLMGWNLMMDEHKRLKVEGEEIGIVGIQNWGQGFHQYGDLKKALTNTDDLPVKLLLSHDPSHWRAQVLGQSQVDVSFAGHTHGMQYGVEVGPIKWSPVQWRYKEWAGLYQEGKQQLYVNRGYGYLGYPGRLGILPEITIFELQKI